jgi:predicted ATP-dependent endonuclease of OLD family
MFLKRVQVPDFRALKNVDISFEPQLTPHVFPLGSQNGGGKSTLLQLIFVLLHCAIRDETIDLVENLFQGFKIPKQSSKREIASIDIIHTDKSTLKINFYAISNEFLVEKIESHSPLIREKLLSGEDFEDEFSWLERNVADAFSIIDGISYLQESIETLLSEVESRKAMKPSSRSSRNKVSLGSLASQIEKDNELLDRAIYFEKRVREILDLFDILYLSKYCDDSESGEEGGFIVCEIDRSGTDTIPVNLSSILLDISSHVFLAAPSTQIFLFMPPNSRQKLLEQAQDDDSSYADDLQSLKDSTANLFTYDFTSVDYLVNLFAKARNKDYAAVVKTGTYGNSYHNLLQNMNSILGDKEIKSREDLSGIQFFLFKDGQQVEISLEDLSHGELKRFGVHMWLISAEIEHSIVLMDEIELALHPDWQYQIVRDLVDWGPTNQYILATHSYSLCEAVTPAHVKEISPHFLSSSSSK